MFVTGLTYSFLMILLQSTGLGFSRNDSGRRVIRRTYRFEFTETGNSRIEGQVIMLGEQVESVTMILFNTFKLH